MSNHELLLFQEHIEQYFIKLLQNYTALEQCYDHMHALNGKAKDNKATTQVVTKDTKLTMSQ